MLWAAAAAALAAAALGAAAAGTPRALAGLTARTAPHVHTLLAAVHTVHGADPGPGAAVPEACLSTALPQGGLLSEAAARVDVKSALEEGVGPSEAGAPTHTWASCAWLDQWRRRRWRRALPQQVCVRRL